MRYDNFVLVEVLFTFSLKSIFNSFGIILQNGKIGKYINYSCPSLIISTLPTCSLKNLIAFFLFSFYSINSNFLFSSSSSYSPEVFLIMSLSAPTPIPRNAVPTLERSKSILFLRIPINPSSSCYSSGSSM